MKMSNCNSGVVTVLFFSLVTAAAHAADAEQRLNFVSCPIVRDTSTVPCWLAEYGGEIYYLGIQTDVSADFRPPFLGHQVLVEGVVSDQPRICGGVVLEPIKVTPMPERDASCYTRLPAVDEYTIDFNPRPPGPSGGRLAFEDNPDQGRTKPKVLDGPDFLLTFDFDRSIEFRHALELKRILDYAGANGVQEIRVYGNRGSTLLSDGSVLSESEKTAERRARDVARLLRDAGLEVSYSVRWSEQPAPADGVDDWQSRSVLVETR